MVFPSPAPTSLTLKAEGCSLILPVREPAQSDIALTDLPPAEGAAPVEVDEKAPPVFERGWHEDRKTGQTTHRQYQRSGPVRHKHSDLTLFEESEEKYSIHPDDPTKATVTCRKVKAFSRGEWDARLETEMTVRALADVWQIEARLVAYDAGKAIFEKEWAESINRDLV